MFLLFQYSTHSTVPTNPVFLLCSYCSYVPNHVFVAISLLRREIATMSSRCKSVTGPIFGLCSLPEVESSSARQVGEISVGFIRRSYVPTAPTFLLMLCSFCSYVPADAVFLLFLCSYCSYLPTSPMFLLLLSSYCSYVPTDAMFLLLLCSYCSYLPTAPMFLLMLCSYCSYVPTDAMFSLPLCSY